MSVKAEIISIGDELLIGQVVNTNASTISRKLNEAGIGVERVTTIGDEMSVIIAAFERAWSTMDVLIVTGGLGPTHDDISKAAVAEFFGKPLRLDQPTLQAVQDRFKRFGYAKMPEANVGQAMVPEDFTPLANEKGTAPGLLYHDGRRTFVILPGVPVEMEYLLQTGVLPFLSSAYKADLSVIIHRTILTTGIGESLLAEKIGDPAKFLPEGVTLAFLPNAGSVRLRITGKGSDRESVEAAVQKVEQHIRTRTERFIYGDGSQSLQERVVAMLRDYKQTISTAESCTGGLIAARLTDVPGSSAVFLGSIVSYDNAVKCRELGVLQTTLDAHGAVSEETAIEMAAGVQHKLGTHYALSATGIAGPDGGTDEKPVGLVWIGLAEAGKPTFAKRFQFAGDRSTNRERSVNAALDLLRQRLLEK